MKNLPLINYGAYFKILLFIVLGVLYSQNLLICQNEYCIAVIKASLSRRDSGFFLLRSPRGKIFLEFFRKRDEILLKFSHCIIEST